MYRIVSGKWRNRPTSGRIQNAHNSSGVAPPAIAYAFNEPTDAPTIRSGLYPGGRPLHTPACQAPKFPPPEKTSARFIFCASPSIVSYNRNVALHGIRPYAVWTRRGSHFGTGRQWPTAHAAALHEMLQ